MLGLHVLIVDDEKHNRDALSELVQRLGHDTHCAADGREALDLCAHVAFDLVLTDVRMPRLDGIQLFEALRTSAPHALSEPPIVAFMTAYGRVDEAVSALRHGALHFLTKPLRKRDVQQVLEEVGKSIESRHAARVVHATAGSHAELVFRSRVMADVVSLADRVAATLASVLIVGESGTGKELLARRIHSASPRASQPFIAVNAAAIPETLLESELFGHEKGAYTGADMSRLGQVRAAQGGTFFIDEAGAMPAALQAKWLRVIQERCVRPLGAVADIPVDVRWIAASNENMAAAVRDGRFREDLYYRLNVVSIELPPLRERPEDVEPLACVTLARLGAREGRELTLSPEALVLLEAYPWPGNVRELLNVLERAMVLCADGSITAEHLPPHVASSHQSREIRVVLGTSLEQVQDRLIEETLRLCGGDKTRAAQLLGVNARTIYRWLEMKSAQESSR